MNYQKIKVEQGSDEWKKLRLKHLTASQAPIVMGMDPYRGVASLWEEKTTGEEPPIDDFKARLFAKGHEAERAGRDWLETHLNISIPPTVLLSKTHPDLLASLDGFNEHENIIFEAKYMGKNSLEQVRQGVVKPHHLCQVQAQLGISGASRCIYFATDESGDAAMMDLYPDQATFEKIAEASANFMKLVREGTPPEATDADYFRPDQDERFKMLAGLNAQIEKLKAEILNDYKAHGRVLCDGVKIVKSFVKGSVKYSDIPELAGVDLEKYRGKSTTRTTVTFPKREK